VHIDRLVEKVVYKDVPVDRVQIKEVPVPVEKIVVKEVEVPVERIVDRVIEKPVEKVVYQDRIVYQVRFGGSQWCKFADMNGGRPAPLLGCQRKKF